MFSLFSYFTVIGPRTVKFRSVYKCVLSTLYEKKDNAIVKVKMEGKSGEEIWRDSFPLNKAFENKTIEIDVSIHNNLQILLHVGLRLFHLH